MLKSVQEAKKNADDSSSWLKTSKGRSGKKATYDISNGKMHQSGERSTIQNSAG